MPDWIYTLPDDGITVLLVVAVVGADAVAALAYRLFTRAWLPPTSAGLLLNSFRLVITLTALVLAFSLVQAQTNLREIQTLLTREASALDLAERESQHLDGQAAADLRVRLIDYGRAIITNEWPLLARGQRSTRLNNTYADLMHLSASIEQNTGRQDVAYNDLLKNLDLLAYLRDERITAATNRLPAAFWHAIEAMTLVSVLLAAAIPATLPHRLSTLLPSAALAVLIALVIIVDVPFQGQSAIRPTELQQVLDQLSPNGTADGSTSSVSRLLQDPRPRSAQP